MFSHPIFSRISLVLAGKIATSVVSFATFVVLSRELELVELGSYVFLLSVASLVSMISNWGTNELLFRACSTDLSNAASLFRIARLWKFLLALVQGALFLLYLALTGSAAQELVSAVFLLIASTVDAQSMSYITLRRTVGDNRTEAIFFPVRALVKLTCIAGVVYSGGGLWQIALTIAVVNIAGISILWLRFAKWEVLQEKAGAVTIMDFQSLMVAATPYALFSVIGAIYSQNGSILTSIIAGKEVVAIYGVGLQFYQVAIFLPVALNIAIQPSLSRLFEADRVSWAGKVTWLYKWLSLTSFVMGISLYMILPVIIEWAFDERYVNSIAVVRILMMAFMFRFLASALIGSSMISANKVALYNRALVVSLIANIGFNVLLIPEYGAMGAALSLLLSEFLVVVTGSSLLLRGLRTF